MIAAIDIATGTPLDIQGANRRAPSPHRPHALPSVPCRALPRDARSLACRTQEGGRQEVGRRYAGAGRTRSVPAAAPYGRRLFSVRPAPHLQCARVSSMTLPSLGSVPGATSSTFPPSLVTARSDSGSARPDAASCVRRSRPLASWRLSRPHGRPRVASVRRSGWRRPISATCSGRTNMPLTFVVWSARPIQPRIRAFVRPHGDSARQDRRQIAERESDPRDGADRTTSRRLRRLRRQVPDRLCRAARSRPARPR